MQISQNEPYSIIQGGRTDASQNPFIVRLKTDLITMDPFDLTGVSAITCCFMKQDGTDLVLSLGSGISIVGNPLLGKLLITLTAAQTALLNEVAFATLELAITFSGDPLKVQILNAYEVVTADC